MQISTFNDLMAIASQGEKALSLGDGSPKEDVPFYLYRGESKHHPFLLSHIQGYASQKDPFKWKETIEEKERTFLDRFLAEIEPYRELNHQYHWYCPPCPKTDTFWYLSVMQHFGCPTRLCDFTSDFWTAVFFATRRTRCATEGTDVCLYRLKCIHNDKSGNKLPKDCKGEAWSNSAGHDMNELLGYIIRYKGFPAPTEKIQERLAHFNGKGDAQMFGWDRPYWRNARIQKQFGFFVYCVDVKTPLGDSINDSIDKYGTTFERFQISANIVPEIRSELERKGLIEWKVFLDLDRAFEPWRK
jgi:hypothetical protein